MSLTVWLAQVQDRDSRRVGPKAANLARMLRAGLPVPQGFCVTADAYRDHVRQNALAQRVAEAATRAQGTPNDKAAVLGEIRETIAGAPLAPGLREEIEHQWDRLSAAVAVRSSATAEDLPGQSFAGQHDTYLGVRDLATCLQRLRDCWASLWSDRAFEYRAKNGISHLDAEMAVIVQALVPAEAAGVIFTADPVSGRRDCAVIEASFGLGEAVVAGKVTPDRVVVSRRVLLVERRTNGRKLLEVVPAGNGVQERPVEPARAERPCLDDVAAVRLTQLAAQAEAMFGAPQDVEWALAGGQIQLLQARPITALPPEPRRTWEDRQIWINVHLREAAPDVVTPATYAYIRRLASPLVGPVLGCLGIRIQPEDIGGLVAGRLYFNVNMLAAIRQTLPVRWGQDVGALFGSVRAGADAPAEVRFPKEDLPELRVRRLRRLAALARLLWGVFRDPVQRGRQIPARLAARIAQMKRGPWHQLSDTDLARRILSADRIPRHDLLGDGAVLLTAAVGMSYGLLLTALCRRWLGDQRGEVAKRLLAGLGGMEDAEAGIALWKLAAAAHAEPHVEAAICREEHFAGVAQRLAGTAAGEAFLAAWAQFMDAHGHHARGELELINPRWSDRPDYVLGLVRSYLAGIGRVDPVAQARRLARQRRRLARGCLANLPNPIKRLIFAAVLRQAQEGLRLRQTIKSRTVRWVAMLREMLLELGRRLAERGGLPQREDVFLLTMAELGRAASGRLDPRPIVAKRRAEYDRNVALDPPPVVFGRYDPQQCAPPVLNEQKGVFHGMGVSPGVAVGKARVILHAGEGHVMPGEVLVAPFTDPGWTPYFLNAAAIVMDQGGQLTHGSIVAREYGIPCVVNVGPASKVIRTGQPVEVDGGRGLVRMLDGPAA